MSYLSRADWSEVSDLVTLRPHDPARQLIANVIQRGLFDTFALEPHLKREAECWCYSDSIEPWSLHWCMDQLDQLPNLPKLRKRIPELRKLAAAHSDRVYGIGMFDERREDAENKFQAERQSWRARTN